MTGSLANSCEELVTLSKHKTRGCNSNDYAKIQVDVEVPLTTIPTDISTVDLIQVRYFIEVRNTGYVIPLFRNMRCHFSNKYFR